MSPLRDDVGGASDWPQDELLGDLPDPEERWAPEPPFDPDDDELREAGSERQMELMRDWFLARYCDPAHETPYESAEGGYIWIWGGPYYADDELQDRFSGIVPDEVINELVEDLTSDGLHEWAPIRGDDRDWEDQFGLEIDTDHPGGALAKLNMRLSEALSVLALQGDGQAMAQLPKMAFGAVISALEAFLWETVDFWARTNRDVLKAIVSNMPDLKDQPVKLGDLFDEHEGIETRVKLYLQNVVWHRFDKVGMLLKLGLGVKPPSFKPFVDALVKRHDIVHRSGHDKEGNPVSVSAEDATALAETAREFANKLHDSILDKYFPDQTPAGADPF